MAHQISPGISVADLSTWLKDAAKEHGRFNDGRINYKSADIAPIIMCAVIHKNKLLLAKRGYGLADAEGYWSTVTGFIDEDKPIAVIAAQELAEELGLKVSSEDIKVGASYTLKNPKEKRSYIVFPCLVKLSAKPEITLDREHTEYAWINRSELENYHILDDLPYGIDLALALA